MSVVCSFSSSYASSTSAVLGGEVFWGAVFKARLLRRGFVGRGFLRRGFVMIQDRIYILTDADSEYCIIKRIYNV